jgi:transcriptional antiterminator NusG
MRIEGSMTDRDVEADDMREAIAPPEEPSVEEGVRREDPAEDVAPEDVRFDAGDPVQVTGAQVVTEEGEQAPSAEMPEPEPVEPEPGDPEPEPEPVEPEPGDPEPEPEPVEPEPVGAETPAMGEMPAEAEATAEPDVVEPVVLEPAHEAPAAEEAAAPRADDPFRGPGDWYVVHTYSGYENKVKANLESRIHTMQMEDKIFGVHIPMEDVMEIKSGKKQVVKKKQFPGYLLVRMVYDNDSWYVVRNTPGVTGFVSAGTGSKPTPLSKHEVEKILAVKKEEVRPQVRLGFEEGDIVRITSGPFADFNGTINEINPDQAKLKVLVNIFDRETPVELSFDQVSKV